MAALAGRPKVVDLTDKVNDPSFNWNDFYSFERDAATSERQGLRRARRSSTTSRSSTTRSCSTRRASRTRPPPGRGTTSDRRRRSSTNAGKQAVRMGVRRRRFRGHDLALARHAVAGGRRPPLARRDEVGVRLSRRAARRRSCCTTWPSPTSPSTSIRATATISTSSTPARSRCCGPGRGTCRASTPT